MSSSAPEGSIKFELPGGEQVSLRPVTEEDAPMLLAIYGSTREEELAQVPWAEEQKEVFLRWQLNLQRREYELRFPGAKYEMIVVDGEPAGRFWTGTDETEIRLLDIALLPQFQRRGIGTLLLKQLIEEALRSDKALRHMVFVLNNDAQRFYDRLGFVVIEDLGAYKHMEWRAATTPQNT